MNYLDSPRQVPTPTSLIKAEESEEEKLETFHPDFSSMFRIFPKTKPRAEFTAKLGEALTLSSHSSLVHNSDSKELAWRH